MSYSIQCISLEFFVKFINKYFITVVSGAVSLILGAYCSLQFIEITLTFVYWSCIPPPCWTYLLALVFCGFRKCSFTSSYTIWVPSVYFSCLIVVAKTTSQIEVVRVGILVLILRVNFQSFIIKYNVNCRVLVAALYKVKKFLCIPRLLIFFLT